MAAAYAALVSFTHIIEQIMDNHARHPIFSHKQQRQIESLLQKVSFLQGFLELLYSHGGGSNEAESLEIRIADATYAAENTIIFQAPKKQPKKNTLFDAVPSCFNFNGKNSSNHFSQRLQKVIDNIDGIMKDAMEIKEKRKIKDQQPCDPVPNIVSSRPLTTGKDTMMEYYDDDLEQIMDKLTGDPSNLQIIAIVGMGGIGKTTLARNVYENPLIVECFDIRAWVTISQEYILRDMLLGLLNDIGIPTNKGEQETIEYHQLGERLHKHLSGRRYLIIMDDIWNIEACEKLKLFLPDNNNGSRVVITTRLSNVADSLGSSYLYKMNLLDDEKSWSLLCKKVFVRDGNCPPELEKIGKAIAENCKGLPLSIVVIGGLLAKSDMSLKYWENVAKDINQIVNLEDNGHWLKTLSLSYSHLPIHLKPCFLYMGVYPEDCEIRISELIKHWVAEGFLKPNISKSLEDVAEDYLNDLVERNLILVRRWGSTGKIKTCGIHDLLRDLCLKEAKKDKFLCLVKLHNHLHSVNNKPPIVFHVRFSHQFDPALQSTSSVRSFSCDFFTNPSCELVRNLTFLSRRVVRFGLWTKTGTDSLKGILQLANLRYVKCNFAGESTELFSQMFRLRYLQTLMILTPGPWVRNLVAPNDIWEMPQLRHIISQAAIYLPDPLPGQDDCVLKNLQTLSWIKNFKCTEDMLKKVPNIKKLSVYYDDTETSNYYLHNLGRLHELQSLACEFLGSKDLFQNVVFPQFLKKLTLLRCYFHWDDFTEKVGSLPHLEKLKLHNCSAGAEWNLVEGKFLCLKFFEISYMYDLVWWTADSTHFPLLRHLVFKLMTELKEIPSGIGDTLQSIKLVDCGSSVIALVKEILEEQQSLGNESLHLTVCRDIYPDFPDAEDVNAPIWLG